MRHVGPIRYTKSNHGEFLTAGNKISLKRFKYKTKRNISPLDLKVRDHEYIGEHGILYFSKPLNMQNKNFDFVINKKLLEFMENNKGIEIWIRALVSNAGEAMIKRAEVIAQYRGAKYTFLETTNTKMELLAQKLGYKLVAIKVFYSAKEMKENKFYVKTIRN